MTPRHNLTNGIDEATLDRLAVDSGFEAPDLIGTVEGWRTWQVDPAPRVYGLPPRLGSVWHKSYEWKPRRMNTAECSKCGNDVPGENCQCGFYSAKTLAHLQSMRYIGEISTDGFCPVVGQLANWGHVVEGSQGWRSQHAYPVTFYLPFEFWRLAKSLSDGWGVPVKLMNVLPKTTTED